MSDPGATAPTPRVPNQLAARPPEAPPAGPAGGNGQRPLVAVRNLRKYFPIKGGFFGWTTVGAVRAVDDVTFDVARGETLGLVGESGCGKSTLGRTLLRLIEPTSGSMELDGRDLVSLGGDDLRKARRRMQIVFQDPYSSLNPRMTVGEIVGEGPLAQGMTDKKQREALVRDLLAKVGLNQTHIHRYPHEFSGGQRQRIGVARALAVNPEFVVLDEPVSALDVSVQSQVLNLLGDLQSEFGLTYLFISHNLAVVEHISTRVGVMYVGKLVEVAGVDDLYATPAHPYTVALLSAVPETDARRRKKRIVLRGDVPSPIDPPSGCRFHTRCWLREQLGDPERCSTEVPELRQVRSGHVVACHYTEELTPAAIEVSVASSQEEILAAAQAKVGVD